MKEQEEKKPQTIMDLNDIYRELFHLEDNMLIPLLATVIIGAKSKLPCVWLFLVGNASGGKTSALSAFSKIPFVTQVSDFTPNTLLSGAQSTMTETSLLKKLGNNFVVVMKDFTTILSKGEETQDVLMGQLREVYDGWIVKHTGLGKEISWGKKDAPNRSVFIMASTEGIYKIQERFSEMGSRGLNYVLVEQDRKKTTKFSLKKAAGFEKKLLSIQERFRDYVNEQASSIPDELPDLPDDFEDDIIEVADFTTICRSIVLRDYRGLKNLALSAEYPMRVAKMMMAVGKLMIYLNRGELTDDIKRCIFKIGFDCIPKQTKLALAVLAKHYRVNNGGLAKEINYPEKRAQEWAENLNMFGVVMRHKHNDKIYWGMTDEYRKLMNKYFAIELSEDYLVSDDMTETQFNTWME